MVSLFSLLYSKSTSFLCLRPLPRSLHTQKSPGGIKLNLGFLLSPINHNGCLRICVSAIGSQGTCPLPESHAPAFTIVRRQDFIRVQLVFGNILSKVKRDKEDKCEFPLRNLRDHELEWESRHFPNLRLLRERWRSKKARQGSKAPGLQGLVAMAAHDSTVLPQISSLHSPFPLPSSPLTLLLWERLGKQALPLIHQHPSDYTTQDTANHHSVMLQSRNEVFHIISAVQEWICSPPCESEGREEFQAVKPVPLLSLFDISRSGQPQHWLPSNAPTRRKGGKAGLFCFSARKSLNLKDHKFNYHWYCLEPRCSSYMGDRTLLYLKERPEVLCGLSQVVTLVWISWMIISSSESKHVIIFHFIRELISTALYPNYSVPTSFPLICFHLQDDVITLKYAGLHALLWI